MQQYVSVNPKTKDVQQIEDAVLRVFNSLYNNPLLNNPSLVLGQVFTSGTDLIVNHKLNRVPNGYIVVNANAAAHVYTSASALMNPTTQIILKSDANVTASLLFF